MTKLCLPLREKQEDMKVRQIMRRKFGIANYTYKKHRELYKRVLAALRLGVEP